MRPFMLAATASALISTAFAPLQAQGLFRRLADGALSAAGAADAPPEDSSRAATPDAPKARPAPSPTAAKYPSQLAKPENFAAIKQAYEDFGKVRCTSCEGGFAYDGWPVFPRDGTPRPYNGSRHPLGLAEIGHVHRWKGAEADGSITIVREETISGFRCRHLTYRLTRGNASAERPGLLCWGYANQFAGSEGWNEVY